MGSSASFGSFTEEPRASQKSCVGGVDDSDDAELGYLEWVRAEKVGVGGVEPSDTLDWKDSVE